MNTVCKEQKSEYEPYMRWCDVEFCPNEGANGGGCWRETGYWTVCSEHSAKHRKGDPQPKMKQSSIDREKSRDPITGCLPSPKTNIVQQVCKEHEWVETSIYTPVGKDEIHTRCKKCGIHKSDIRDKNKTRFFEVGTEHELRREDIINLGWEIETETVVLENFRYFLFWKGEKHKTAFVLNRLNYKPNEIQIYKYGWEDLTPDYKIDLFRGVITNVNDLKRIMTFVEILEPCEQPIDFHIKDNIEVGI